MFCRLRLVPVWNQATTTDNNSLLSGTMSASTWYSFGGDLVPDRYWRCVDWCLAWGGLGYLSGNCGSGPPLAATSRERCVNLASPRVKGT